MTYEEQRTTVVRDANPVAAAPTPAPADRYTDPYLSETRVTRRQTSGSTLASRIVVLVFGMIQLVIALRIVLLLLDAREGNALVRAILDISQVFVAPFEGILRTNALTAGGSVLDVAAILALIGWTLLEMVVLAVVRIARPGEAV
jgi:hypothetical protein